MKLAEVNKKQMFYKTYVGKTPILDSEGYETGDYKITYSDFKPLKASISPSKGTASVEMFGENLNYSRTIITDDMSCDLDENSLLWVSRPKDESHDYIVVAVAEVLYSKAYAIRKVEVSAV